MVDEDLFRLHLCNVLLVSSLLLYVLWFYPNRHFTLLFCNFYKTSPGLVVSGDDLLEFHQAVVSTLRETDDMPIPLDPAPMAPMNNINSMNMNNMNMNMNNMNNMNMMMDMHHSEHQPHPDEVARIKRETQITDLNQVDHNEDESDNGSYRIFHHFFCLSLLNPN